MDKIREVQVEEAIKLLNEMKSNCLKGITGELPYKDTEAYNKYMAIETLVNAYNELKSEYDRSRLITVTKLTKLIEGINDGFPITLGNQQPLWSENTSKYVDKKKIRSEINSLEDLIKHLGDNVNDCILKEVYRSRIQTLLKFLED